jgi:Tol biopolymer transport system component
LCHQKLETQEGVLDNGVVFVSDRSGTGNELFLLPLAEDLVPVGEPLSLTDDAITDPRRPSASADGKVIIFDADESTRSGEQRIYALDLFTSQVPV